MDDDIGDYNWVNGGSESLGVLMVKEAFDKTKAYERLESLSQCSLEEFGLEEKLNMYVEVSDIFDRYGTNWKFHNKAISVMRYIEEKGMKEELPGLKVSLHGKFLYVDAEIERLLLKYYDMSQDMEHNPEKYGPKKPWRVEKYDKIIGSFKLLSERVRKIYHNKYPFEKK